MVLAVLPTMLALPSPTLAPRSFIPHCNTALTGHAGCAWDGRRVRYWVVQAGPCDTIYRERGVKEKKNNWVGRSLFLARRKIKRRYKRWGIKHHLKCKSVIILLLCRESLTVFLRRWKTIRVLLCDILVEEKDETDITVPLLWRDSVQWMKIVVGNVLRAEHRAKGTGGALDQSAPEMRGCSNL